MTGQPQQETALTDIPWLAALVYHAAFILFVAELIYDMTLGGMLRLAGVQAADLALLLLFGFLGFYDSKFQRMILSPTAAVFGALLLGFAALGVLFGNSMGWIRTDLRILLWLPGGMAMFYLLPKMRHPARHFLITCLICVWMLHLGAQQSLSTHFSDTAFKAGEARLYGLNLFAVGVLMLPLLGIYLTVMGGTSRFHRLAAWGLIGVWTYYIVFLSATRNLMLSLACMILAVLPYYLLKKRDGLNVPAWNTNALVLVSICVVVLGVAAGAMEDSLVFERFGTGDFMREDSARGRVEELVSVYRKFDKIALISGSGLGTVFQPYASYEANFLHLGTFTFLFKFGVLGFAGIVVFFYILVPALLTVATFDGKAYGPRRRTALLVALPPLMPWIIQTSISSGFTPANFMAAGMCLAFFMEIDANGVRRLQR